MQTIEHITINEAIETLQKIDDRSRYVSIAIEDESDYDDVPLATGQEREAMLEEIEKGQEQVRRGELIDLEDVASELKQAIEKYKPC